MSEKIVIEVGGETELSPWQRDEAIRSVQAMAMPAIESRDRTFEREAALAELAEAVNGPLLALVKQDAKARRAIEEARPLLSLDKGWHIDWLDSEAPGALAREARTFFTPPYHFHWSWRRMDGSPPSLLAHDDAVGSVRITGASGPLAPGSGSSFVEVHAGFGIGFRAPRDGVLVAASDRRFMQFIYEVGAYGLGSWALAEGGTECSIMTEGNFKAGESRKKFHKRVSIDEGERFESNLFGDGLMRHEVPVLTGVDYQFNIGAWLFVDNRSGVGQSGALTAVRCDVDIMQLNGP